MALWISISWYKIHPIPHSKLFAALLLLSLLCFDLSHGKWCDNAKHPQYCISSMKAIALEFESSNTSIEDGGGTLGYLAATRSVNFALGSVKQLLQATTSILQDGKAAGKHHITSVTDCVELLGDASELITDSITALKRHQTKRGSKSLVEDAHTWISGALTQYTTCLDGLLQQGQDHLAKKLVSKHGYRVEKELSNTLALIASLQPEEDEHKQQEYQDESPPQSVGKTVGNYSITPNVTVAKDGTGQFTNITAALSAIPSKNKSRFTIYIKAGVYFEYLDVPKVENLVLVGDGIGKTIITGNKSVQDPNITTFTSATVVVRANGIIVQGITFQNTAGAINHQAVAVRVTADQVSFFRCSFEGYQDTLYAHSLRQFYTQCDIYGTVDYIFGNAAAVFQNCNLYARVPMNKQKNTYTAQGRTDPNQNTGYSFHNCLLDGVDELRHNASAFPTYLGRPWKEYSLTIFIKCYEGSVLHPAGWLEWSGDFALSTLFNGEYFCYGPGSAIEKRVNWSTQVYDSNYASRFTASSLINGGDWLPQTNLPFTLGL